MTPLYPRGYCAGLSRGKRYVKFVKSDAKGLGARGEAGYTEGMKTKSTLMKHIAPRLTSANGWFLLLVSVVLLVLALLVRQQINWLNQASASALLSGQKELALTLTQGIDTIRNELQAVYRDIEAGQTQSDLVEEVLLIPVSKQWPEYPTTDARHTWVETFKAVTPDRSGPFDLERLFGRQRTANQFLLISGHRSEADSVNLEIRIVTLDLTKLTKTLLQPALAETLLNYDYRIAYGNTVLLQVGIIPDTQAPELTLPLTRLMQIPVAERRQRPGNDDNANPRSQFDRDFAWLFDGILNAIQQTETTIADTDIALTVYSPKGALTEQIAFQKWRNSVFSILVLGLLTVTVLLLVGMTRRMRAQQQRERDFIATISHELRTPLTVIRSAADNLKDGMVTSPESITRYGLEISKQSKRLSRMIDTTLTFSGLPGRDSQQLETVQGSAFFEELFSPLVQLASEQNVTCHLAIQHLDYSMNIDVDAVRVIAQNLLMNALIHAKPKTGPAHVWIQVDVPSSDTLRLRVADNGPGIAKKEQRKVFAPFVRGARSEQEQLPGTGLGLSLVQRTAAILNGSVTLQSPYQSDTGPTEQGCCFTVELPLEIVDER
ncbi:HAMP domain-containing sensor histidine kinase [Reinekea sp. G2M2-21]|uniref:sensor histidine kinase n=1 Tax=Reinekea sp. G2M2-21 TaxID=2788942 RepID=UPI0018ABA1A2|nr:HAMP domain-containing sensor histidine kinase [Reinekea sp. G2M2-21]